MELGAGQDEQNTMLNLAKSTGGRAFFNTNDFKGAIQRTLADSRRTYDIGYYPDTGEWHGEYHTLELRLKKPRAVLRYRKGYFAVADPPSNTAETQDALQAATSSPVDATGLAITAKVETIFPATRKLDLRVGVDIRALRLERRRWPPQRKPRRSVYPNGRRRKNHRCPSAIVQVGSQPRGLSGGSGSRQRTLRSAHAPRIDANAPRSRSRSVKRIDRKRHRPARSLPPRDRRKVTSHSRHHRTMPHRTGHRANALREEAR